MFRGRSAIDQFTNAIPVGLAHLAKWPPPIVKESHESLANDRPRRVHACMEIELIRDHAIGIIEFGIIEIGIAEISIFEIVDIEIVEPSAR